MFTIDLLKGQGIPARTKPEHIAVVAAACTVPALIAMVMFGVYLTRRVSISIQKQEIATYEAKAEKLVGALEMQKTFEQEKALINTCLAEVASSIDKHAQWSPVVTTLVESMPDSMVLTNLEVKQRPEKRKVPGKESGQTRDITVPVTTLTISVRGNQDRDYAEAVKKFMNRLRFSDVLGPKLEDIRMSQEDSREKLDGKSLVSYVIRCIFKPKL
jgi:Tfp pilus assembly protein PilN